MREWEHKLESNIMSRARFILVSYAVMLSTETMPFYLRFIVWLSLPTDYDNIL
jgi:hypothetical protein